MPFPEVPGCLQTRLPMRGASALRQVTSRGTVDDGVARFPALDRCPPLARRKLTVAWAVFWLSAVLTREGPSNAGAHSLAASQRRVSLLADATPAR